MRIVYKLAFATFLMAGLFSCVEEDLNPVPDWEDGVTGFGVLESGRFKAGGMDTSKVVVSISWNNYGKDVTINKIEAYVHWVERYFETARQQNVTVEHFSPTGKTSPALVINNPDVRVQYSLTITPNMIYNLFKDATHKYNGPTAVNVFQNPEIDRSDPKTRFRVGDTFFVTWYLYATDGRVFRSWSNEIKAPRVTGANTEVRWTVVP